MWSILRKNHWTERRGDQRAPARELDAVYTTDSERKSARVKDISAMGLYLFTKDPWQPGTDVQLTLRNCDISDAGDEPLDPVDEAAPIEVQLRCKAVRVGEDGVGMAFEPGSTAAIWTRAVELVVKLTGETDRVRLLRESKAMAFLLRISPEAEEELLQMIATRMSRERSARAFGIALRAEEIATARRNTLRNNVSAKLVLRILEDGAKADEGSTRDMWAELLAASCNEDGNDVVTLNYVTLLSRLDAVQIRIFEAACRLGMQAGWEQGFRFRQDLHRDAEEIKRVTHLQNMVAIERDLNHLFELGLVEQTDKPILCEQVERVNMTPTELALKFYAQCKGQPQPPEALEGADLQKVS